MIGYRDLHQSGAHHVTLDYVLIQFCGDGICWNPTAEQISAMRSNPLRGQRFERIEMPEPPLDLPLGEPFAEVVAEAMPALSGPNPTPPRRRRVSRRKLKGDES